VPPTPVSARGGGPKPRGNAEDLNMVRLAENYGTKILLTQADNAVVTSCDYLFAADTLNCRAASMDFAAC